MPHTVYLALGTNLGDRHKNLFSALDLLASFAQLEARSNIYETDPWGYTEQPAFLNMCARITTELPPLELLQRLKVVEQHMGRVTTFQYGPRLIDLDIIFYDDLVFNHVVLQIPHPRLYERAFVLVPLAELAPELHHPILGKTVLEMMLALDCSSVHPFTEAG